MRPSNDLACAPPPSSTLDVVVPATLVGLVGVGLGILLGRTVLAPKQPAATPAPSRVNPGGGLKDVGWDNNVIDAPGLDQAIWTQGPVMPTASPVAPTPLPTLSPSACWSVFQSLSVAQQGWVASEMLYRFGFSDYVQEQNDAALGARLRAISQAARAKVGSAALQPKFVNERLRALQVALRSVGQDRRDVFCQLVASQAPYAAPPVPTPSPAWSTKSPMSRVVPTPSPAWK
jgi:hypothetical protein